MLNISSKAFAVYNEWARYAEEAMNVDIDMLNANRLVLSGMGGSGTTADIISNVLYDNSDIPIHIVKGYHLPSFIDKDTLVIAISVSGNTEETISVFAEAYAKDAQIIGVSSGGLLEKLCKVYGFKHVKIKQHVAPRYSLPSILFATLRIVARIDGFGWLDDELLHAKDIMYKVKDEIINANLAKELAKLLRDKIAAIYTSPSSTSIGIRFKNSLNENAKTFALTSDIIEASHNEIVSFASKDSRFMPIFVKSPIDGDEVNTRFELFKRVVSDYGYDVYEVPIFDDHLLANIIASIYMLDYASIYLACIKGIDPLPIDAIMRLKDLMKGYNYLDRLKRHGVSI